MARSDAAIILHSPTERDTVTGALRTELANDVTLEYGGGSELCERRGVDFMWRAGGTWWGMQRKAVPDLLASFDDGRLAKEIQQMHASVRMPTLVIEGKIRATTGGDLLTDGWGRKVPMSGLRKRLWTVQSMGVAITYTDSIMQTAIAVREFAQWTLNAERHSTAAGRPKPTSDWGKLTNRDYQSWMLQGLPNVGRKTADAIVDTIGFPLRWGATVEELCTVPGVGKTTAQRIISLFDDAQGGGDDGQ